MEVEGYENLYLFVDLVLYITITVHRSLFHMFAVLIMCPILFTNLGYESFFILFVRYRPSMSVPFHLN